MGTALHDLTINDPDESIESILHIHGTTFATGSTVSLGSGTDTALVLWADGVGVRNAAGTFKHKIVSSSASSDKTLTLPNATGTMVLGAGEGITDAAAFRQALGETVVTLAADHEEASDTLATVGSFSFTPVASGIYAFEFYLMVETATAGTAFKLALLGPTVTHVSYHVRTSRGAAVGFDQFNDQGANDFGVTHNPDVLPIANKPILCRVSGMMVLPVGAPAPVQVQFASEVNTETVTLLAGSSMIFKKLN